MKKTLTIAIAALACASLLFSVACSKSGSSGGDPGEALMGHMKTIFKLMKDNKDNCDKLATEVVAYTDKNKTELEGLGKALAEMEKKMSEEEKKKYEEKMKKQAEEMLKESMAVMMEVGQKCPTQMQKIGEAMKFMENVK